MMMPLHETFGKMIEQGKVRSALQYLSRKTTGGILHLDDMIPTDSPNSEPTLQSIRDVLQDKHPAGNPQDPSSFLPSSLEPNLFNQIIFENLNADSIHRAAMHTQSSAGPSGLDSFAWRRLCSSFGSVFHGLCSALAAFGLRLCSSLVNPESISPFVACRLIPLDKCPGVRRSAKTHYSEGNTTHNWKICRRCCRTSASVCWSRWWL